METGAEQHELTRDARRHLAGAGGAAALVGAVIDAIPLPTLVLDPDGIILRKNAAWVRACEGYEDRMPDGAEYYAAALALRDDAPAWELVRQLRELARGERTQLAIERSTPSLADGQPMWFHIQGNRLGEAGHVVLTHTNFTLRVMTERASAWQARHDHLTGLPNRPYLHELIDEELDTGTGPFAVLFIDVDGFKDVNDSLGHDVGDALLRELAARLTEHTRAEDIVGRFGGDEFVVLCRDCDADGAQQLARRFAASFDQPFLLAGRSLRLTASIGIATLAVDAWNTRSGELVRDADLAMNAAKAAGPDRIRVFTPDLRTAAEQKVILAAELREAIERGQLVLHYQPIVHLPSGRCSGVEALVRWQHPERGLLHPGDFLPTAEQAGLMVPLARWGLGAAARQNAAWRAAGLQLVTGVNIAAQHFATGTLVSDVLAALAAAGLPADHLLVELTETSVAEDPEAAAQQCAELRRHGVEVAIDDFGSGFSSLSQLVTVPAGILKIDRSLVAFDQHHRERATAAIAAVVALGRACGIRSLAEGVETVEQLALARELGCTFAQGFHFARPMPAEQLPAWAAAHERSVAVPA